MDDIAAAVAAMNEAAAILKAHVAAAAEPVDLSELRDATGALNAVLHPAHSEFLTDATVTTSPTDEPSPAEVTVPDPVNGDPGPDVAPATF